MSSSSSDSDDSEPIRKIKINIKPKEAVVQTGAADVDLIKASVEAWRPLGPPTHPSLSRRQSSLSSMSSMSFGNGSVYGGSGASNMVGPTNMAIGSNPIHFSPSCSSLVNEFNTRSPSSNFVSGTSRTSSPLMSHSDTVPIAIAIQESIEVTVKGQYDPEAREPKFQSRSIGNIKVAFPNAFARSNHNDTSVPLKLRIHNLGNITRYYASRLIRDLDYTNTPLNELKLGSRLNGNTTTEQFSFLDAFMNDDLSRKTEITSDSKIIEFDMDALSNQLRTMYNQSPNSRYYNLDILRYQINPINSILESPIQVCAYWKAEAEILKLRIDFRHSEESGFNLERLREISFNVELSGFIPEGIEVDSLPSGSSQVTRSEGSNNNNNRARNFNVLTNQSANNTHSKLNIIDGQPSSLAKTDDKTLIRLPPPPLPHKSSPLSLNRGNSHRRSNQINAFQQPLESTHDSRYTNDLLIGLGNELTNNETASKSYSVPTTSITKTPYITFRPQAHWDKSAKRLSWKFDTLLPYYKTDGMGSLLAKLDYRNCQSIQPKFLENCEPVSVDVKFLVVDSTLSKMNITVDTAGYKISLLKKEIRSGRYKSEPYIF